MKKATLNKGVASRPTIALASDHAGYRYKERVKPLLESKGYAVRDFGTHSEELVDYPHVIRPAALAVAAGECEQGIIFGGSGNGEAMTANKVAGIRCAVCWNLKSARLARKHNNANMISIGQRMVKEDTMLGIVEAWLTEAFLGGRHQRRLEELARLEAAPSKSLLRRTLRKK